jgi:orotate phosphoribosyltransferase
MSDANTLRSLVPHRLLEFLVSEEVIKKGHFVIDEGGPGEFHHEIRVDPRAMFRKYSTGWRLSQSLFVHIPWQIKAKVQIVAGPPAIGAVLANCLSSLISAPRPNVEGAEVCTVVFTKDDYGVYGLQNNDRLFLAGKQVLLVDDVRHTGRLMATCSQLVRKAGGIVLASATVIDRSFPNIMVSADGVSPAENYSLIQLVHDPLYRIAQCRMCKEGIEITRI